MLFNLLAAAPPALRRRSTLRRYGCPDADRYRCHFLNDSGTCDSVVQERVLSRERLLGPASYCCCWRRLRESARLHRATLVIVNTRIRYLLIVVEELAYPFLIGINILGPHDA